MYTIHHFHRKTIDTPIIADNVVTNIGVPQYEASYTFGQFVAGWIIGKLGGKAKIGIMLASSEVQLLRRDGFLAALAAIPGAKVVAATRERLEDSFKAHGQTEWGRVEFDALRRGLDPNYMT